MEQSASLPSPIVATPSPQITGILHNSTDVEIPFWEYPSVWLQQFLQAFIVEPTALMSG
jgi:hypothetical protein